MKPELMVLLKGHLGLRGHRVNVGCDDHHLDVCEGRAEH